MTRTLNLLSCVVASLALLVSAAQESAAAPLTLNLIPAESHITLTGAFGGGSTDNLQPQEGIAGVTDLVPGSPSNRTTFQGTITIDVDNVLAPTSIQIVSSAAAGDTSGVWLPEVQNNPDGNGDGDTVDFGLPPGGDSLPAAGDNPAPAANADWSIKVPSGLGPDIAFGAYRDISYNVTSAVEPVVLGQFSSLSQIVEPDGTLDYWVAQGVPGGNVRGRTDANTGDDYDNKSTVMSSYTLTPLGGGLVQARLVLPIQVDDMGDTLRSKYNGQFVAVANLIIPEPASVVLLGMAGIGGLLCGLRKR